MDLIEQLGGYEESKKFLSEIFNNKSPRKILNRELLEYRRQHNIFEVGDKVVLISNSDDDIFEYTEYSKNLDLHFFESKNNYGHASLSNIRHATDAEIKAGKRLDGLKEDV